MDEETSQTSEVGAKKSRKRYKQLFRQIQQQMEFYFSDANLHKDRYIKKLMDQSPDGYIDLTEFSNFNKLRALTSDMSLVAKALSRSKLIQVSDDKKRLKRKIPLSDPKDVDARTVYVESLPLSATHDWVKKIFEVCGNVAYVSLPKYKTSRDIKGFAFVEFESVDAAHNACQLLHNPPAHAADKYGRFPKANKQIKQLEQKIRTQKPGEDLSLTGTGRRQRSVSESAAMDSVGQVHKRKRTTSAGSDGTDEPKPRRLKTHSESSHLTDSSTKTESGAAEKNDGKTDSESQGKADEGVPVSESRKRKLNSNGNKKGQDPDNRSPKKVRISDEPGSEEEVTETTSKKRARHRKRKRKDAEAPSKKEVPELTVIPKVQWSSLRTEYLELQKSSMRQLKEKLHKSSEQDHAGSQKEDAEHTAERSCTGRERPAIQFIPNVIVKVTADKELSRKEVKEVAAGIADVAYVDIVDGSAEGFIRCDQEAAAVVLVEAQSETYRFTHVKGEEEASYWDKLRQDRENKLSNKTRNKQRGRDKLFKRAEKSQKAPAEQRKHVVFDDD